MKILFLAIGGIAMPYEATGSERGIQIGILSVMALSMMTYLITFLQAMTSAKSPFVIQVKINRKTQYCFVISNLENFGRLQ